MVTARQWEGLCEWQFERFFGSCSSAHLLLKWLRRCCPARISVCVDMIASDGSLDAVGFSAPPSPFLGPHVLALLVA